MTAIMRIVAALGSIPIRVWHSSTPAAGGGIRERRATRRARRRVVCFVAIYPGAIQVSAFVRSCP
jgi:hypothetical protein